MPDGGNTAPVKFSDPDLTARGEKRAHVDLAALRTLWVNTGTLCNIACEGCYIESSPKNDRLAYLRPDDLAPYLAEIAANGLPVEEIGFTGGEPFMNPHILTLLEMALEAGHRVLILTNAMKPMTHRRDGLLALRARFGDRLGLRVSLDHHTATEHDALRGAGSWTIAMDGLRWLASNQFRLAIAGRTLWEEPVDVERAAYGRLFTAENLSLDAMNPHDLVLFPEMEDPDREAETTPEITTACWGILGKRPEDIMCASSRMIVRRQGTDRAVVLACTLIAYDDRFELGETLAEASRPVALNHPHCSRFCVLGGASCSA